MAFSFLYLAVRALLAALVRSRRGLHVKDVELLVLRHELEILRAGCRNSVHVRANVGFAGVTGVWACWSGQSRMPFRCGRDRGTGRQCCSRSRLTSAAA
jgi:hypothetical protein